MRIRKTSILDSSFFLLNFILFCSLNGIIFMLTKVGQVASPLILITCLVIIFTYGISLKSLAFGLVLLFFLQFLSYYIIGIGSRLYLDADIRYQVSWKKIAIHLLTSFLIILAYQQYFFRRLYQDGALERVLTLIFIPVVLSMLILVLQPFFGIHSFRDASRNNDRGLGVFSNPNIAATVANIGLVFAIDFLFRFPKKWIRFTLILILAIVASILPLSRTGFFVMGAVLVLGIFYFLFKSRVHGRFRFFPSLVFILLPLLSISYLVLNYDQIKDEQLSYYQKTRLESVEVILFEGKIDSKTTAERTELWAYAFEAIPQSPIAGYGVGYFDSIPRWIGVHNTFLLTIGNSGLIPFLLLITTLIATGIHGFKRQRTGFLILGLSTVCLLTFMTSHNGYSDKVLNLLYLTPVLLAAYDNRKIYQR